MSWTPIDEWRERQAEERRVKEEYLIGTPCLDCPTGILFDCFYNYRNCGRCRYNESEESWERICRN